MISALVTGGIPPAIGDENSSLEAIYNCQRLLEEMWPRSLPSPAEPPRQFGRYIILRELGRGAFGVVFLASDSVLGRKVALEGAAPSRTRHAGSSAAICARSGSGVAAGPPSYRACLRRGRGRADLLHRLGLL